MHGTHQKGMQYVIERLESGEFGSGTSTDLGDVPNAQPIQDAVTDGVLRNKVKKPSLKITGKGGEGPMPSVSRFDAVEPGSFDGLEIHARDRLDYCRDGERVLRFKRDR